MRTALVPVLLACAAGLTAAGSDEVSIATYRNTLVVTAPAGSDSAALDASLIQRVTVDFQDATIAEVAEFVRRTSSLNVVVAPELLAQGAPITIKAQDMELGNLLKWVDRVGGLHHGWLHGALYFGAQPIRGEPRTMVLDVSDLVLPVRHFPGPDLSIPQNGNRNGVAIMPITEPEQPVPTVDELAQLIERQVNPR